MHEIWHIAALSHPQFFYGPGSQACSWEEEDAELNSFRIWSFPMEEWWKELLTKSLTFHGGPSFHDWERDKDNRAGCTQALGVISWVVLLGLGPPASPTLQQKSSHAHFWIQPSPFWALLTSAGLWAPVSHSTHQASVLRSIRELEHSSLIRDILNMGPLGPVVLKITCKGLLESEHCAWLPFILFSKSWADIWLQLRGN